MTQLKDNAKATHARVQGFNSVTQEWEDVLISSGALVTNATINSSTIVNVRTNTYDAAANYNSLSVGTAAVELTLGLSSSRTFLSVMPTTGTIFVGDTSAVTVSSGTPVTAYSLATWEFNSASYVKQFAIAASTIDTRVKER